MRMRAIHCRSQGGLQLSSVGGGLLLEDRHTYIILSLADFVDEKVYVWPSIVGEEMQDRLS